MATKNVEQPVIDSDLVTQIHRMERNVLAALRSKMLSNTRTPHSKSSTDGTALSSVDSRDVVVQAASGA